MSIRSSLIILFLGFIAAISFLFLKDDFLKEQSLVVSNNVSNNQNSFPEISPQNFPSFSFKSEEEKTSSFPSFSNVVENSSSPSVSVPEIPVSIKIPSVVSEPVKKPALSDKEIFSELWPDYYRDFLSSAQDILLEKNLISSPKLNFDSEENIYRFLDSLSLFYKNISGLSDSDFSLLQNKISQIPSLKKEQEKEIIGALDLDKFISFFINKAEAFYVTTGFCYKDNAPMDISMGYASPIYCCNCGIKFTPASVFVPDCGIEGVGCDLQIGCLNGICRNRGNGLYDPTTLMCGCG